MYKIDAWLARNMFHPPMIGLCRMLNLRPIQLVWILNILGFVSSIKLMIDGGAGWWLWLTIPLGVVAAIIAIGFIVVLTKSISRPESIPPKLEKTRPTLRSRLYWWLSLIANVAIVAYSGWSQSRFDLTVVAIFFILAEYAEMIKTIPPREKRFDKKAEAF